MEDLRWKPARGFHTFSVLPVFLVVFLTSLGEARAAQGPSGKARPSARSKARPPADPAAASAQPVPLIAGTVRGRVVLPDGTGTGGLRVSIDRQRTFTDRDGWFEIAEVPATYCLAIAEAGGRFITAYFGLTRRDPIVTHTACAECNPGKANHQAVIEGAIQVPPSITIERVRRPAVFFLSPDTAAVESRIGYQHDHSRYRVRPTWGGSARTRGVLVAFTRVEGKAYLAKRALALIDGEPSRPNHPDDSSGPNLKLEPAAMGQIAGTAPTFTRKVRIARTPEMGKYTEGEERELLKVGYLVPGAVSLIHLGGCKSHEAAFVCDVPDLSALGGEYCVAIATSVEPWIENHVLGPPGQLGIRASRCGGRIGMKDFNIGRASPPDMGNREIRFGPWNSPMDDRDTMAWSAAGLAIYQLNFGSCAEGSCLVAYVTKTSFSWADFEATGMTYLRGSNLLASVSAFSPPMSMDAWAAASGHVDDRATWERADSRALQIELADPPSVSPSAPNPDRLGIGDLGKLPTCSSSLRALAIGDLRNAMDGTRISVRGKLKLGSRGCTMRRCLGDPRGCCNHCGASWRLVDAGNPDRHLALLRQRRRMGVGIGECDPDPKPVEAVATGVLLARAPRRSPEDQLEEYFLDDAILCAARSGAQHAGK